MKKIILESYLQSVSRSEPTHSDTREYVQKCDGPSTSSEALIQSNRDVHIEDKPYRCGHLNCDKTFKFKHDLLRHERTHTGEKPYQCEICKKSFRQIAHLNRHKLTHVKRHKCDKCEESYTRKINLLQHKAVKHNGKRLYKCDQCVAAFIYRSSLLNHRNLHTGKKHFCEICGKAFARKYYRNAHRSIHDVKNP